MDDKKVKTRFTIQFSRYDPSHLQVAEILNRQAMRGKAQYIVNAVMYFESHNESDTKMTSSIDKSYIESIVDKMLRDREKKGAGITPDAAPLKQETIGANGLIAVASTLEMFRNR